MEFLLASLLCVLTLHLYGVQANSAAFHEMSLNVLEMVDDPNIVTKEIVASSSLQCVMKASTEMNLEDSGVICYKETRCLFSDCNYKLVKEYDASAWNCYGLEILDRYAVTIYKKEDGMYYFFGPDRTYDYAEAVEYCEQVPGFSLPTIITRAQYEVAKRNLISENSNNDDYWLGLAKDPSGIGFHWPAVELNFEITKQNTGEDVRFNDNSDAIMFHFYQNEIHDLLTVVNTRVVCQGNLENLDWTTEILN